MKTYLIKEIFGPTIQGEGSHAGTVVCFIRFSGCNRWSGKEEDKEKSICSFCDTDFVGGKRMTRNEIMIKLDQLSMGVRKVVISGGEPLLQLDEDLLEILNANGYEIHVETNGSKDIPLAMAQYINHITMSPKQGIEETKLSYCDDLKLLFPYISDKTTMEAFENFPSKQKYLQPVMDVNYEVNIQALIIKLTWHHHWKLSLQTHKLIGVE